jgi:hypothetical protein
MRPEQLWRMKQDKIQIKNGFIRDN